MSTISRFWSHTKKLVSGCLVWTGKTNNKGYGMFSVKIGERWKTVSAHRWLFGEVFGIAPSKIVMHSCDNPPCIALQHLDRGTLSSNLIDAIQKGRRTYTSGRESPSAKLTAEDVAEIRRRYGSGGISQESLAEEFGVWRRTIYRILRGKR